MKIPHVMSLVPLLLLLLLLLSACPSGSESGGPAGVTGSVDPATVAIQDWEWFAESRFRLPEIKGRVVGPDGAPIPAAPVDVMLPPPVPVCVPKPVKTITADEDGRFLLRDVPQNAWIRARPTALASRVVSARNLYRSGDQYRDVRCGEPILIRGMVKTADGDPVPGVSLMGSSPGDGPFAPSWVATAETDREGKYEIAQAPRQALTVGVVPGRYVGMASGPEELPEEAVNLDVVVREVPAVSGRVVDDVTGEPIEGAIALTVVDREVLVVTDPDGRFRFVGACQPLMLVRAFGYGEVPVRLNPAREEEQTLRVVMPRGGRMTGRVVDQEGNPLAGVRVKGLVGESNPYLIRGPLSGEDGRFDFSWVPVGNEGTPVTLLGDRPDWMVGVAAPVTVGKGEIADVGDLEMVPPGRLRGRLTDEGGAPLADAILEIEWLDRPAGQIAEYLGGEANGLTDAEGNFEAGGLRSGTYRITVMADGYVPWRTTTSLRAGETKEGLELSLPRGLSLAGTVHGPDGKRPEGARITLFEPGGSLRVDLPVAEDGTFRVQGLAEKEYVLQAYAPRHESDSIRVPAGKQDCRLDLRGLSTLTIFVSPPPDDSELEGRLEVRGTSGEARIQNPLLRDITPERHEFSFENLPAGVYYITAQVGNFFARKEILLVRGNPAKETLSLEEGGTLTGRVRLPEGKKLSGIGVEYVSLLGGPPQGEDTDAEGRYTFRGVPPGDVTVRVHPAGYPPTERTVTIRSGAEETADLVVKSGGRIRVVVKTGDGTPVPGVAVSLVTAEGQPARFWTEAAGRSRTGEDGVIDLVGLLPGRYTVLAIRGSDRQQRPDIEVKDSEETPVEFVWSK